MVSNVTGDLISVYKYLKGNWSQKDEIRFFSVVRSDRTRKNGLKLEHRKFCTNMQNFLMGRVVEHWHRLPGAAVESPSVEIFKTHLDTELCDLL